MSDLNPIATTSVGGLDLSWEKNWTSCVLFAVQTSWNEGALMWTRPKSVIYFSCAVQSAAVRLVAFLWTRGGHFPSQSQQRQDAGMVVPFWGVLKHHWLRLHRVTVRGTLEEGDKRRCSCRYLRPPSADAAFFFWEQKKKTTGRNVVMISGNLNYYRSRQRASKRSVQWQKRPLCLRSILSVKPINKICDSLGFLTN